MSADAIKIATESCYSSKDKFTGATAIERLSRVFTVSQNEMVRGGYLQNVDVWGKTDRFRFFNREIECGQRLWHNNLRLMDEFDKDILISKSLLNKQGVWLG